MGLLPSIAPRPGCRKNTGVSAMDSGVAPHFRGAGPIFLRPVFRNPVRVVRWSAWLASEAAAPRSVLPLKPRRIDLGMRFIFIVVMHGLGRGRGKSKCGTCQGCKRRKGCVGRQRRQWLHKRTSSGTWIQVPSSARRRRQRLCHHRCETPALLARKKRPSQTKSKCWIHLIQRWATSLS